MRSIRRGYSLLVMFALGVSVAACGGSAHTVTTEVLPSHAGATFSNYLVVGVGDDYESRSMFERKLAARLRAKGVGAAAYYAVGGGNKPIDRTSIEKLVQAEGYDAVLISRALDQASDASVKTGSAGAKAVRREGRPVNLFRYDYEELNEPVTLDVDLSVTFSTELFETTGKEMIWRIESTISDKDTTDEVITAVSETIVQGLSRERFIGR